VIGGGKPAEEALALAPDPFKPIDVTLPAF
jgi:hypothetical protein